jgi:uncharacterized membrane protein
MVRWFALMVLVVGLGMNGATWADDSAPEPKQKPLPGGAGGKLDPEKLEALREKLKDLTPEQRQQLLEKLKARRAQQNKGNLDPEKLKELREKFQKQL